MAQSWGEGFKTRRVGKKKYNTPNNIGGLETWPTLPSEISRLFLICQEPWISRYYSPSLFCMVKVYIIDVNMRIKLFTCHVSLSLFLFDCLGFNFPESGYASNYPKVSEFVYFTMKWNFFCFSKHYLFVNDNITSMNYLKRKSYLPISIIMGVNS